ncbi:uncharacterized protein At2g39795, mitochondrial-like [Tasmannia lanceolata]|uniref:uncharacterized protein At2g39795, mitochondrial-like n=1 Tax=Tasmannia lanceolata TaxID=3420 RepID=UPI004062F47C
MALFLQRAQRAFLSHSFKPLIIPQLSPSAPITYEEPNFQNPHILQSRNYITEMRKSAFEGNILRILRTEIQYQNEYAIPKQPVTEFGLFTVEDRPREQWIRLRGKYGEKEEIKVEVTMFDGLVSTSKSGDSNTGDDARLHISLIVDVSKGDDCDILEFICSAWPDSLQIQKVFILGRGQTGGRAYMGPNFNELDDELQNSLQEFLEARGVNDDLAVFLHQYMMNKDQTELIRWMEVVKSFIEK